MVQWTTLVTSLKAQLYLMPVWCIFISYMSGLTTYPRSHITLSWIHIHGYFSSSFYFTHRPFSPAVFPWPPAASLMLCNGWRGWWLTHTPLSYSAACHKPGRSYHTLLRLPASLDDALPWADPRNIVDTQSQQCGQEQPAKCSNENQRKQRKSTYKYMCLKL